MDLDEDKILNDPREAVIQAKMMAEIQAMMPQPLAAGKQPQSGAPSVQDLTGSGGGNIGPGNAPEPGAEGFTGTASGNQAVPPTPTPQGPMQ